MQLWETRIKNLKENLKYKKEKKQLIHKFGKNFKVVPFNTTGRDRLGEDLDLDSIVGEFSRILSNTYLKSKIDLETISKEILSQDSFSSNSEEFKNEFKYILKLFIENNLQVKAIKDPSFYRFLIKDSSTKSILDYADYIYSCLYKNNSKVEDFFSNSRSYDLISKQISKILEKKLTKTEGLNLNKLFNQEYYQVLIEKFNDDLIYLTEYPDYFLKNIKIFFNFYLMIFIYKLTYNICLENDGNFEVGQKLYFAYESEKTNEQRRVKDSGFKNFKDKTQQIYYHITTLEHFNIIFDKENYFYKDLEKIYNEIKNKYEFSISINLWLEDYKEATGPEKSSYIYNENDDFKTFYKGYMDVIAEAHKDNNRNNTGKRLHITLESISKANFLKKRGPLGYTFNIDQNFLFLLVAIITKKERIILKKFFDELELRGIFLDNLSKRKIVEILEKNNLIEKKSDSGEAQYVKSIL